MKFLDNTSAYQMYVLAHVDGKSAQPLHQSISVTSNLILYWSITFLLFEIRRFITVFLKALAPFLSHMTPGNTPPPSPKTLCNAQFNIFPDVS